LWIHPYSNVCDPIAVLWIDNVFIEDCIDDITYNNTSNLPTMTRRGNFISTLNSVNVTSSQNVTFIAGNYIDLKPGFTAQNGCSFTARIQECGVFGNCSPGNTKQILNSSLENTKENQYETYYSFYPNPVVDKSYFHYDKNEYAYVFIYSSIGKLVNNYELSPSKNSFCISTSDYDAGLYVYKIIMSDNIIKKGKFIVIK